MAACCVLGVLFSGVLTRAGDEMTPSALLKASIQQMEAKQYDDAVSSMYMYLDAVGESEAPRVLEIAQDIRFKLATILIQQDRLGEAAAVLQDYIDQPIGKRRTAMKMLSTCLYETDEYAACVEVTTNALYYNAHPDEVAVVVTKKKKKGGNVPEVDKKPKVADDPEYTDQELILLHLTLGEAFFKLEKWAECIDPYTYVIEHTPSEQRKGYAIMQVVNALIKIPDFKRITAWIPQLYRTDARYDIRVNLALMNAAAALYDAGEYDSALPLYRMIIPRDELVAYQQGKLREMRVAAGLPPEEGATLTEDEQALFGGGGDTNAVEEVKKPKELVELEGLVAALEKLPPYENNVDYRMAQLYRTVDRYWEGLRFFERVYAADPEGDLGERSIYEIVGVLLDDLGETAEAEKYAFAYIGTHKEGITPRQIAYMLTSHYQKLKEMEPVKKLLPYIDEFVRTNDTNIVRYDVELYYMQAIANLMTYDYSASEKGFKRILDEFPGSHQEGNALYWYAMSKLFQQDYAGAYPVFEKYLADFPSGGWVDEATFQGGICLFGMEKYDEALKRFGLVIANYPNSDVFPGACSMRGDIYGSRGELDKAVADYKRAVAAARKASQATYAVFQMAEVYEAEEKYNQIVDEVQAYLDTWQDKADIAKALFWIGKTRIQQGMVDEAVETYLDAIVRFGSDVRQDGVDMMIAELEKISAIWLGADQQAKLVADLQAALERAENPVLKLRLRVAIAKLTYTEIELGKQLIKELPNLDDASPPVLAAICDASFEMKDYSRAKEMLKIFQDKFEDSDYMRAAYKLRAYGQYAQKDYEGALETIEEAQETYGTDRDVAWAQLMKAQVLLDMGKIAEAREANMNVLNVPAWRGEPVAQATYQLGQVEEAAGEPRKAFGFYQRTYFQYKGLAGGYWAAEAYLASARCLGKLGLEKERINTYKAMLYDPYVNGLPQADKAREALGAAEAGKIANFVESGGSSNIAITVETEIIDGQGTTNAAAKAESAAPVAEEVAPAKPESAAPTDAGKTEGES